ncbi:unnamed protein product [Leuciscus chuanchicus]
MPFKEFIQYWREYIQNGHSSPKGCLYLKDWHMQRNFPEHNTYKNPIYFSSDWLNEYWDTSEVDDYRFVYMGPKGSWTPFHADVFRSYSWSANICGRKKWLLYPPGQEEFLRDCHGNLAYDVTAPVLQDKGLYAQFEEACQPLEIIQEAGEIIFVPSGWHHQVYNLVSNNGLMVSKYVRCIRTGVSNPCPGGPMSCLMYLEEQYCLKYLQQFSKNTKTQQNDHKNSTFYLSFKSSEPILL